MGDVRSRYTGKSYGVDCRWWRTSCSCSCSCLYQVSLVEDLVLMLVLVLVSSVVGSVVFQIGNTNKILQPKNK
jgi:hypothetical protein